MLSPLRIYDFWSSSPNIRSVDYTEFNNKLADLEKELNLPIIKLSDKKMASKIVDTCLAHFQGQQNLYLLQDDKNLFIEIIS